MLDYSQLHTQLSTSGAELSNFESLHQAWQQANKQYINSVKNSQSVVKSIKNNVNVNLDHISSVWDQAVLYYFLWITFGEEVPHNDYANFFSDSDSIRKWLKLWIW
jgi:hypothetical protein